MRWPQPDRRPWSGGVCHLTTSHPPADTRILLRECRSLAAHGYQVELHVVTAAPPAGPDHPAVDHPAVDHPAVDHTDGGGVTVRIHRFALPGRLPRLALRPLWAVVVGLRTRCRVIHIHDPEMLVVAPLFRLAGRSVVYDVHEDVPRQIAAKEWLPPAIRPGASALFERVENWCTRRMSLVVAATDTIADRFERIHPRVHRVRNFASREHFAPPAPMAGRRWDACYVGVLNASRGIDQMLAVAERSEARVVIAGPCHPPELAARLEDLAVRVPTFEFRGEVPYVEATALIGAAKIGMLLLQPTPNHIESQPNKLFEYLASGTPVLGPNFPLFSYLLDGKRVGVTVDPTSACEAISALRRVLDDEEELQAMSERARSLFERCYSWDSELAELLRAYESLPATPSAPPVGPDRASGRCAMEPAD